MCFGMGRKHGGQKEKNAGFQHFLLFPQCFQNASFSGKLRVGIVWWYMHLTRFCQSMPHSFSFYAPSMKDKAYQYIVLRVSVNPSVCPKLNIKTKHRVFHDPFVSLNLEGFDPQILLNDPQNLLFTFIYSYEGGHCDPLNKKLWQNSVNISLSLQN